MLRRKIDSLLEDWKNKPDHKPLILKGCRQCGKTFSVRLFAKKNYKHVVYINFLLNPEYSSIFAGSLEIDHLVMLMESILGKEAVFIPYETIIILDEIQDCPEARTSLKFFKEDGRYDVIGTGSLLGVKGYGKSPKSIPVGYETVVDMFPLDFEEFLWANDIKPAVIDYLKNCLETETPVAEALHKRLMELLHLYVVIGGMPNVVDAFVENHQLQEAFELQRNIVRDYEDDMVKYANEADRPFIKECFQSIPKQLAKENKKFQYSTIKKNAVAARYANSIQWIEDAGIIKRCFNLSKPELPLDGQALQDYFKIYMVDTGLFVSKLEPGTQQDIFQGNLLGYKGAIFENLMADMLSKMGRNLYFYRKESGLEIDFVIRYKGKCTLVEVKATTGNAKSLKTVLKNYEKYHIDQAFKFGNYNIGRNGQVLTLPLYMGFLLTEY